MDSEAPLLVDGDRPKFDDTPSLLSRLFNCGRGGQQVPSNAETVQRLMDMKITLRMTRDRAEEDYHEKAAEVAKLAKQGLKRQAYESMRTAKQYKQDWETRHAMHESVERIKSRLIAQQHNMALFASFAEANQALAKMLEDVPLEKVEEVLDEINERMQETHEVSSALGSPATDAANQVDEDELARFLGESGQVSKSVEVSSSPAPVKSAPTTTQRLLMD